MKKVNDVLVVIGFFGSIFFSAVVAIATHKAWMKLIDGPTLFDLLD